MVRLAAGALLALAALPTGISAQPRLSRPAEPMITYNVRKGDTLYALSRPNFPGSYAIERVRRLNNIADVRRVLTGRTLVLPRSILADERSEARVENFSGDVTLHPPGAAIAARVGAAVGEGTVIRTGRGGFATLRLADGSTVSLPSQSTVRIVRLRRILLTGAIERTFAAETGRVRATVTPMPPGGNTFEVRTPLGVAAVRGTDFRVSYDPAAAIASTEVENGKVWFAPPAELSAAPQPESGAGVLLAPGYGARAGAEGPGPAVPLLAAPRLVAPDAPQTGLELAFAVEPMADATAYHLQIARDAGMLDLIAEASAPQASFSFPSLPTGTYFVRVSAIDSNGLEGLPRTYGFDRVLNTVSGTMGTSANRFERRYQFRWFGAAAGTPQYRFQLARTDARAHPVVDEPLGTATALAITNLAPGEYSWRVLSLVPHETKLIPAWSSEQTFEVTARK